ncbi:MAG: hypothetical protein ACK5Q5_11585 [Planctomycetaceae bacterium]
MPRSQKPPSLTLHKPSGQARVRYQGKDLYFGAYGSPESFEAYGAFLRGIGGSTSAAIAAGRPGSERSDMQ